MKESHWIEVSNIEKLNSAGISTLADIKEDLGIKGIKKALYSDLYLLYFEAEEQKLKEIAEKVFTDPLTQEYSIDSELQNDYDFSIEVRVHKDVTDNAGMVANEAIEDFLGTESGGSVRTSRKYYLYGASKEDAERIAKEMLANDVIETYEIKEGQK